MDLKSHKRGPEVGLIPFLVFLLTACSLLPWSTGEKRSHKNMKERALADQEVVIVDGEEYVKVAVRQREASSGRGRYRYVPVDEYLSKRGQFSSPQEQEEAGGEPLLQHETGTITEFKAALRETGQSSVSSVELKRKLIIGPFEKGEPNENWGEMVAEGLRDSLESRAEGILCLDDRVFVDYLIRRGLGSIPLDDPMALRIANTVFGVHALLDGTLSGPYVSASAGKGGDGEETALAIVRVQAKLVEAATGRVIKAFEKRNPIFATEQRGKFSRERAKLKAIELAIDELAGDILHRINQMEWYARIVKIDGSKVYLNAGRLTGLRVGDLMDVYGVEGGKTEQMVGISVDPFEGQRKGQLRVSQLFGADAAMANITKGGNFALRDVATPSMGRVGNTARSKQGGVKSGEILDH